MTSAATSCCCSPGQHQEDNQQQPGQGLQVHPCYIQTREENAMEAADVEAKADEVPEEIEKWSSMKGAQKLKVLG